MRAARPQEQGRPRDAVDEATEETWVAQVGTSLEEDEESKAARRLVNEFPGEYMGD